MRVAMVDPFGLGPKGTMRMRALPMAQALAARGHEVEMFLPPWSNPGDSEREEERGGVKIHNITLPPFGYMGGLRVALSLPSHEPYLLTPP